MRFTDRAIKALKAGAKRRDIRESGRPGFAIRVFPSGTKSWIYIYKRDGRTRRLTLGQYPAMTLTKAHEEYAKARSIVKDGGDPAADAVASKLEEKRAATVAAFAVEYMERWAKPRKRTWKEDQRILDKDILPAWGRRKMRDITRRDINLILDAIMDRGAPESANRTHALIHKMFNFAVSRDVVPFNPCAGIGKPARRRQRDRVLTDAEVRTHWNGIMESSMSLGSRVALLLQLTTAQRKGEIISMRWDEIDGDWWTIPAARAKNGLAHKVPLTPQALALLERMKGADSEYVFPSPKKTGHVTPESVDHALRRYLERLEKPIHKGDAGWFTPHDLRRTAATRMTEMGISRLVVSKILNHAETGVTAIYDRNSYDREKRQALEAWGRRLDAILTGEDESSKVVPLRTA